MKKYTVFFTLFVSLIVLTENPLLAAVPDYRSKASGNWSATASWEQYNGSTWVAASSAPTSSTAGVITILSGHNITVDADVTVDQVVVNSGGSVSVGASHTLIIADGAGTDMSVSGTLYLSATGGTITTTGTLVFASGGKYTHQYDGGAIPTATWDPSSTCEITGLHSGSGFDYGSTVQVFGNVTWYCSSWGTGSMAVRFEHIQGNLTVQAGSIDLWYTTTGKSLTIDGNLNISGGTLNLGFLDDKGATAVNLNGDLNVNSGSLTRTYTTGSVTFNFSKSGTQNFNLASSVITGTYIDWSIASTSTVNMGSSVDNWTVSTSRTLTLNGTLDCNSPTRYVSGGGRFTSAAGSTLVIRSQDGISLSGATGQIQVTGTRTFNASANYSFLGDIASFSEGTALVSANDITINNTYPGTLTLGANLTVNGNIYLTSGWIDIGSHDLTLGSSATLHEDATNVVTTTLSGKLVTTRTISNVTSANIGGLGFIITTAANMGSTVIERHHTLVQTGTHCIKRWYTVTPTNNTGLSATIVFSYNQYELNTIPQSSLYIYKSSNFTTWSQVTPFTRQSSAYTLTATGVGSMSYWTAGDATLVPVELTLFNGAIRGSNVVLQWKTATEVNNFGFDIERKFAGNGTWKKLGFVAGNGTTNAPQEYTFTDQKLVTGKYTYRLKQIDNNGEWKYSPEIEIVVSQMPQKFALLQNYPNPFNPTTMISFGLPSNAMVSLKVYDALGREVSTLLSGELPAGTYSEQWSAAGLPSGEYFYRLQARQTSGGQAHQITGGQAGMFTETKRLILLR